jgi:hypothetical protein
MWSQGYYPVALKDNRVNPSLPNNTPFPCACRANNSDKIDNYNKIAELLLEHPLVNSNFNDNEAVRVAAKTQLEYSMHNLATSSYHSFYPTMHRYFFLCLS